MTSSDGPEPPPPTPVRLPQQGPESDSLSRLRDVSNEWARRMTEATHSAVAQARLHGKSWTEIGRALGISRQAARQRFGWISDEDGVMIVRQPDGSCAYALPAAPWVTWDPRQADTVQAFADVRRLELERPA